MKIWFFILLMPIAFFLQACSFGQKNHGFKKKDIVGHYYAGLSEEYFFFEDGTGREEIPYIESTRSFDWNLEKDSLFIEKWKKDKDGNKTIESVDKYKIVAIKDTVADFESVRFIRVAYQSRKYYGFRLDALHFGPKGINEINEILKERNGWLLEKDGLNWLETEQGKEWLASSYGQAWLKTAEGIEYQSTETHYDEWIDVEYYKTNNK